MRLIAGGRFEPVVELVDLAYDAFFEARFQGAAAGFVAAFFEVIGHRHVSHVAVGVPAEEGLCGRRCSLDFDSDFAEGFDRDGYIFNDELSSENDLYFTRQGVR